ncbi:hypothetical protein [Variovorax guangxiensis]|uniref:hypothetical protein n=1 Tax=Variovorax guangxiensis TaxID=1775474 RepID=UPI00285FE2DE|nr:hypothetical protein [Variovorax guangxiensis]MDR6861326.1 hypothetical protein [Variovorax guangxiensis]
MLDTLVALGKKATDQSTSTLCGMAGGATGLGVAYGLSLAVAGVSFVAWGPILTVVGVGVAVVAYRGTSRFGLERRLDEQAILIKHNEQMANETLEEIKKLEKMKKSGIDVPSGALKENWAKYTHFSSLAALRSSNGKLGLPPALDSRLQVGYSTEVETVQPKIPAGEQVPVPGRH